QLKSADSWPTQRVTSGVSRRRVRYFPLDNGYGVLKTRAHAVFQPRFLQGTSGQCSISPAK
ncbi:MAG TPA: hypothetical protein VNG33_12980, partial [Polyangiaceae bacterium]|nr:hypothetical protein [Polyangiaceae bacterium]